MCDTSGEEGETNPCFLSCWTIQGKNVIPEVEDRVTWKESHNENFSIMSLFGILEPRGATFFLIKLFGTLGCPQK